MGEIDKLPLPALLAFGAVLAIIFAVRYMGLSQGEKADPAKSASTASVAAVIVDPTALNRLSDKAEAIVEVLGDLVEVGQSMARTEQLMAQELDRIREEMRIQREVRRSRD